MCNIKYCVRITIIIIFNKYDISLFIQSDQNFTQLYKLNRELQHRTLIVCIIYIIYKIRQIRIARYIIIMYIQ